MTAHDNLPLFDIADPAGIDDLLSKDELDVRSSVRSLCQQLAEPDVAAWFESGRLDDPRDLMKSFGDMAC